MLVKVQKTFLNGKNGQISGKIKNIWPFLSSLKTLKNICKLRIFCLSEIAIKIKHILSNCPKKYSYFILLRTMVLIKMSVSDLELYFYPIPLFYSFT